MDELSQRDRLQPSLLDRLTDKEPDKRVESRARRVMSLKRLRESVIRDVGWLLNTVFLEATEDLDDYPEVRRSVVNYGSPDLAGKTASSSDTRQIARAVKQAILDFEPRLIRNSVQVNVIMDSDEMSRACLAFEIDGELWAQPTPTRLFLRTRVDLDTGGCAVSEQGAAVGQARP